ncbi:MAG: glycosyltransferase family 4 protein [Anaerolineae bacterium]
MRKRSGLRIGIDYTAAVRQGAGVGRYTRGLVDALAELDRQNEYVLLVASDSKPGAAKTWPDNFRLVTLPLPDRILTILWHRLQLPLFVDLFCHKLDIFHSPNFVLPPVRRGRTLVTVHDLSFLRYPVGAEPSLRIYLQKVVPRSVRRADKVLADSECTQNDIVELLGIPAEKVKVVYAGVDERFRPIVDGALLAEVRARYALNFSFILSLGTLEPRKNYLRLVEAYALLKARGLGTENQRPKLVIAGGKGWLYEPIFRKVDSLGLKRDVRFLGFVPDEDLPALYTLADLFAFPSHYEGFGLPALEAMACGTPVVASDRASLPEIIGDAGLLVSPDDREGLATTMARAWGDGSLREEMREKGLEQARRFTWRGAAENLLQVYLELRAKELKVA